MSNNYPRKYWWVVLIAVPIAFAVIQIIPNFFKQNSSEHQQVEYFGKVLDDSTKAPVYNAKVSITTEAVSKERNTDSYGVFKLKFSSDKSNQSGELKIEVNDYQPFVQFIKLAPTSTNLGQFSIKPVPPLPKLKPPQVKPEDVQYTGRVIDEITKKPVQGAKVSLTIQGDLHDIRLNPPPPARISLRLKLDKIYVLDDGPGGDNEWIFEVKINDRKVLSVPKKEYDNKYADKTGIYPFDLESDSFVVEDKTFELKVFGNIYKKSVHVDGLDKLPSDLDGKDRLTQEVSVQSEQAQFNFFFTIMKERE